MCPEARITTALLGNQRIAYSRCTNSVRVLHYGVTEGGHDVPTRLATGDPFKVTWDLFKSL